MKGTSGPLVAPKDNKDQNIHGKEFNVQPYVSSVNDFLIGQNYHVNYKGMMGWHTAAHVLWEHDCGRLELLSHLHCWLSNAIDWEPCWTLGRPDCRNKNRKWPHSTPSNQTWRFILEVWLSAVCPSSCCVALIVLRWPWLFSPLPKLPCLYIVCISLGCFTQRLHVPAAEPRLPGSGSISTTCTCFSFSIYSLNYFLCLDIYSNGNGALRKPVARHWVETLCFMAVICRVQMFSSVHVFFFFSFFSAKAPGAVYGPPNLNNKNNKSK